jgi:glycosyltransferase involved in cell wall biosynthesis
MANIQQLDGVTIAIPTHNRADQLDRVLASINDQKVTLAQTVEVVVVANGCSDSTESVVKNRASNFQYELRYVDEPTLGLNSARNRAVSEAKFDVLIFLDDDVKLLPGYIESTCDTYLNHDADIVGGKTELWWETVERPSWFPDELLHLLSCKDFGSEVRELHQCVDLVGANFSFRKRIVETIGPFRLGLDRTGKLLLGGGETEFLNRAFQNGFKAFYSPGMHLLHWVAPGRPTSKYLTGVAQGTGMSYIFARPNFSLWKSFKWTVYHTAHFFKHFVAGLGSVLTNDKKRAIFHKVKRCSHFGYISGIVYRLAGKSTLQES